MAETLTFYTNPMSRGQMIRWMLEEVGQPYETEILDYASTMKQPRYLAINPMGKVPAIMHGEVVVTECAAICAYLADAFPQAGLAPAPTSPGRGSYYRWLFFAAGCVEPAASNKAAGFVPTEQHQRMFGYGSYERMLETLEAAVSGVEYLAGGKFSAADLYVASQLNFGMTFGTIEKRPAFEAYTARLVARPAFQKAKDIDNALIAEMQKSA